MINQHPLFSVRALCRSASVTLAACSMMTLGTLMAHSESVATNGDIHLSAATYTVAEAAGSVTLIVERSSGTSGALSVTYATMNDTAIAGKAYTAKSGTLTWADGDASNKYIVIPIANTQTTGTTEFFVRLKPVGATIMGPHTSATVDIVSSATTTAPKSTKSIKEWGVSCNDSVDDTPQFKEALAAAANNAFTLVIDCPVRFHTGVYGSKPIAVPNGVTMSFSGSGELITGGIGLTVANPQEVTFIDFNMST